MVDILYIFSGSPLLYALVLVLIALVTFLIWKSFKTKYKFIILGVLGLGIITVFLFSFINNQQESFKPNLHGKSDYTLTLKEVWGVKRWITTFERPGTDYSRAVLQTSDGGYVIAGRTNNGTKDCYGVLGPSLTFLLKTDEDGNKVWEKFHYKGVIVSIQQTYDGGLIATGSIRIPSKEYVDVYLIKADADGNVIWEKNYEESDPGGGFSVQQTSDGGYIVVGGTGSRFANQGVYLLKVDGNGNKLWSKVFAKDTKTDEEPRLVQQTSDGGYIVFGWRKSEGTPSIKEDPNDPYIDDDVYLLRTDALGNKIWEKTIDAFGQSADERLVQDALQTSDGGYVIVGGSTPIIRSNGALQSSSPRIFLLKINNDGNKVWAKDYGLGIGHTVQKTSDGGYTITAEVIDNIGPNYLVKIGTDSDGNKLWEKPIELFNTYQGKDYLNLVVQTSDKSYMVLGTREYGDLMGYAGMLESDTLLMKIEETDKLRMPDYERIPPRETRLSVQVEQLASNGKGWIKTVGGSLGSKAQSMQQTSDGGYIVAGWTHYGVTVPYGWNETIVLTQEEAYLAKTDVNGNLVWEKNFDGEVMESVQEASDGGYVALGSRNGLAYLIKTDANGNVLWNKTLTENLNDALYSLKEDSDDGYLLVGVTNRHGATLCNANDPKEGTSADVYIVKTDALGNKLWEKVIGGARLDVGNYVQKTSDGGYIITGMTTSLSERGVEDVYLLKIDTDGNRLWEKAIGGNKSEIGYSVQQTRDGGYIIVGLTVFTSGAAGRGEGGYASMSDVYLIKTDADGNLVWERTFGGDGQDRGYSVQQTSDRGYIITGDIDGYLYLLKTDASGNKIWEKAFKREEETQPFTGRSVQQTSDGGYILVANSFHTSTPVYQPIYLIKTDENGNI